ncbi:hypothetical protein HID58_056787 [Brassica napus]|uniref:MORF/ORRM1/DAG-like MORF domain-containing protein n=1 Tax=Brassica napus TaxID=3708 RepID=A0ABQ8APJ7_BRANA|nr:hypothetical protein HID58_056787 [Brassica napus]
MLSNRLQRALLTATSCINREENVLGLFTEVTQFPVRLFWTTEYKLYKEGDEITQDTVLFEGCDYNHWLNTMDFPKNHPLFPEEMVSTYEQTCATGLGIRGEEEIYACSTMTYQGFQAIMTEQESEKFKDSYIDPQNKEYGGDKYENGVITHRPPPLQPSRRPRLNRQCKVVEVDYSMFKPFHMQIRGI